MNDEQSKRNIIKIRCRFCNGLNLLPAPLPKAPLSAPLGPGIVADRAVRLLIDWLTRNAQDPVRIGKRVQQLAFAMKQGEEGEKLLTLARRQKISSARASVAVEEAAQVLREVQNANFGSRV